MSPDIGITVTDDLFLYDASDGLIRKSSRLIILGVSLYKILNRILKDSYVPLDS